MLAIPTVEVDNSGLEFHDLTLYDLIFPFFPLPVYVCVCVCVWNFRGPFSPGLQWALIDLHTEPDGERD